MSNLDTYDFETLYRRNVSQPDSVALPYLELCKIVADVELTF